MSRIYVMRKFPAFSRHMGVILLALALTSCAAVKSVSSEAYALGLATGQEYAALKETIDNLESWSTDEDGAASDTALKGDEASVTAYCTDIWGVIGITSGLKNSEANKVDFVTGCLAGVGF
jgi:hypothetical protein